MENLIDESVVTPDVKPDEIAAPKAAKAKVKKMVIKEKSTQVLGGADKPAPKAKAKAKPAPKAKAKPKPAAKPEKKPKAAAKPKAQAKPKPNAKAPETAKKPPVSKFFDLKLLAADILAKREKKDLSFRAIESETGIPKTTLADIEAARSMPKVDTYAQVAKWLGKPFNYYFINQ